MDKEVILLVEDSAPAKVLANAVVMQNLNLKGIIIQKGTPGAHINKDLYKANLIKIISRKVIPKQFYRKLTYLKQPARIKKMHHIEEKLQKQATDFLLKYLGQKADSTWPPQVDALTTSTVNSEESYDFLIGAKPELLVVYGTSILKNRIIEIPKLGVLNAHHAILPDYKGNFVEFWQVYNRDYDSAGITIHFIDIGVDTGDIIFQKHNNKTTGPDPFLLRALNNIEVINNYPSVISSVLNGTAERRKQGNSPLPVYKLSDITMDKRAELYSRQDYINEPMSSGGI